MAEFVDEELLSLETIEKLKQQDSRFHDLDARLLIETELKSSIVLKIILDAAGEQAARALEALADVDPTDMKKIISLQAHVFRARFIARTLNGVIRKGELAEQSLNEEQTIQLEEEEQ